MYNYNNYNNSFGQFTSNIRYVTSLEEAVMLSNDRGSDNVYFHQSKPVFYRVKVDWNGQKSWAEFPYNINNTNFDASVNNMDMKNVLDRLTKLEDFVNNFNKEATQDVRSDG